MNTRSNKSDPHFLPKGSVLIAPPTRVKVFATLLVALALTLSPWPDEVRLLVPDFTLMALLYWNIHAPRLAGLGTAFVLGLVIDVASGLHMGLNALSYVVASFVVLMLQRRLENFDVPRQALQIAPILFGKEALVLALGLMFAHGKADWYWLAGGIIAALLWAPLTWLLNLVTGRQPAPKAD